MYFDRNISVKRMIKFWVAIIESCVTLGEFPFTLVKNWVTTIKFEC